MTAVGTFKKACVIGAGIMGQGIAAANVKRRIPVALNDAAEESLARGVQGVLEEVAYNKHTKQADAALAVKYSPYINATVSDSELARADLVIEAIVENLDAKKRCYTRLEPQLDRHAILCSNTSTIARPSATRRTTSRSGRCRCRPDRRRTWPPSIAG